MTTPAELHAAVRTILEALPTVQAFDGDVPAAPPADEAGRVYPYAVLWPAPGGDRFEPALSGPRGGLVWVAQVTVAAGDPTWCLQATGTVRAALDGVWLDDTASPLTDDTPSSRTIARDPDVKPPRWFVPLRFTCQIA